MRASAVGVSCASASGGCLLGRVDPRELLRVLVGEDDEAGVDVLADPAIGLPQVIQLGLLRIGVEDLGCVRKDRLQSDQDAPLEEALVDSEDEGLGQGRSFDHRLLARLQRNRVLGEDVGQLVDSFVSHSHLT